MKNILEFLEKCNNKNNIAIIEEEKKCTYGELIEKSMRVGTSLIKYNNINTPIPIFMEKSINTLCTFFGVVYAGCCYSLINPELPKDRLKAIIQVLESKYIITDEEHYETAKKYFDNVQILLIENLLKEQINSEELIKVREKMIDTDPLYINFTSGSTGIPKGVVINHQTTINFISEFTKKFEINSKDIIGNQAPWDFDVSVKDIYSSISTGATMVIIPKRLFSRPAELLDYLCNNKITTLIWAVSALCLITTFHGLDYKIPKDINKIMFSGEVMPIKHVSQWIEKLPDAKYVNLYGPTEITCNCTYHIVNKKKVYEKSIPIGKSFNNESVFLLDDSNKEIKNCNETGEICVRGSTLALGYYNNLEQTNKSFIQNPLNNKYNEIIYKTGDLGYYDENKDLNFAGRKDFQIKHLGHRVELEEIERAMETLKNVERACCTYNQDKGKIIGFYVGSIDSRDLKLNLKNKLPTYMIPNVLKQIDKFPLNKNGKINRKKLC